MMKSKNDTRHTNNENIESSNTLSPNNDQNTNIPSSPSSNVEEKNMSPNQGANEQGDLNNFNISFFLPKELCKKIEEGDENIENKNNNNNINHFLDIDKKNI